MISIHSDNDWVRPFVPRLFKVREIGPLTETSSGSIAVLDIDRSLPITLNRIESAQQRYRHVVVYLCEPLGFVDKAPLLNLLDNAPSNLMILSDYIFDQEPANHRRVSNWFCDHTNPYVSSWGSQILASLDQARTQKPYRFEALLGTKRPHRDLVYASWQDSRFRDSILLTYYQRDARLGIYDVPFSASQVEDDTAVPSLMDYTLSTLLHEEPTRSPRNVDTINIIPTTIYNNAWYSIITEGFTDHMGTRLTEKTAKAVVAGRLFVYFGAPHDLARMRGLGFRTFDGIIDESYDGVTDDLTRWSLAWQQVEWLCGQDPDKIQAASAEIRLHNQSVFLNTDWYANLRQHLRDVIAQ